jgi:hypothetical protein
MQEKVIRYCSIKQMKYYLRRGDKIDVFYRYTGIFYAYTGFCYRVGKNSLLIFSLKDKTLIGIPYVGIVDVYLLGGSLRKK